jgi:hypothetical protein
MQVDTEPFLMNMIDFEGKKVLIWPNTADKGKSKEIVIDNARDVGGNHKISCKKVVAEKTPDGGETLKVTIIASGTGGKHRQGDRRKNPFCASRMVRRLLTDGLATLRTRNNHVHSNRDDQR